MRGWHRLHREVIGLPLCSGRLDRYYVASDHWIYLAAEQAAFLAGAVFVLVYLLREEEPK